VSVESLHRCPTAVDLQHGDELPLPIDRGILFQVDPGCHVYYPNGSIWQLGATDRNEMNVAITAPTANRTKMDSKVDSNEGAALWTIDSKERE
jgi:hypothetical protein